MFRRTTCASVLALLLLPVVNRRAIADGLVVPPRNYQGSLEELAQEAIIIFHSSQEPGEATEDLILKSTCKVTHPILLGSFLSQRAKNRQGGRETFPRGVRLR